MRVLWLYANAVKQYLKENPVDADAVIFPDYWFVPDKTRAHAVHFIVLDGAGEWVAVDLQNSHQGDFQKINPKNVQDCDRLVFERIKSVQASH
jgi:hypothetical protein